MPEPEPEVAAGGAATFSTPPRRRRREPAVARRRRPGGPRRGARPAPGRAARALSDLARPAVGAGTQRRTPLRPGPSLAAGRRPPESPTGAGRLGALGAPRGRRARARPAAPRRPDLVYTHAT